MTLGQGQEMTLTFNTHICSFFQLVSGHRLQMFWKINSFHFFLWKSLSYQIWPCRKIGQGQPRVIIWTNYDGLESPMLHTKFRGNPPAGSGEEDFWRVFTIYGHGGHLGHVTQMPRTKFRSPYPRRLHIKFGFDRPSGFWEEDVWALWTTTTTDDDGRRTPDHGYTISSPMSLRLRWAKKMQMEQQTVKTLTRLLLYSLMWVCTVWQDLSVWKLRIIMVRQFKPV